MRPWGQLGAWSLGWHQLKMKTWVQLPQLVIFPAVTSQRSTQSRLRHCRRESHLVEENFRIFLTSAWHRICMLCSIVFPTCFSCQHRSTLRWADLWGWHIAVHEVTCAFLCVHTLERHFWIRFFLGFFDKNNIELHALYYSSKDHISGFACFLKIWILHITVVWWLPFQNIALFQIFYAIFPPSRLQ